MIRRLLVASILVSVYVAALGARSERALAECRLDEGTGIATCRLFAPRVPDRATPIGGGRTPAFVWWSTFFYNAGNNPFGLDDNAYCRRESALGLTTTYTFGNVYAVQLRTAAGAPVTPARSVCVFDGSESGLQPPPPPPTEAEFVEAARQALTVMTSLNPRVEIGGLTGLDTWLWCDDPGTVDVAVALRGWTAQASMTAVQYAWAIGGTASAALTASSCGSEASPAASWMPETMGPYSVTLTSTWAGTWTLAYNGFPAGSSALGPFDFAAPTVPYPVGEYRGVLTPPDSEQS